MNDGDVLEQLRQDGAVREHLYRVQAERDMLEAYIRYLYASRGNAPRVADDVICGLYAMSRGAQPDMGFLQ